MPTPGLASTAAAAAAGRAADRRFLFHGATSGMYLHFGYASVTASADRARGLLRHAADRGYLAAAAPEVGAASSARLYRSWTGNGRRIAEAVAGLSFVRGVRGAPRGAVVVICSDGLEQGDPACLGRQMRKLARTCAEIISGEPTAGDAMMQPLAEACGPLCPRSTVSCQGTRWPPWGRWPPNFGPDSGPQVTGPTRTAPSNSGRGQVPVPESA